MMLGGTSGAESQSPESYCAVAKVKVLTTRSPCAAPGRLDARDGDARSDATCANERVGGVVARAQRIDRGRERSGERRRRLERVHAEREQRVDRRARIHGEIVERRIEALRATLGRAAEH